MKFSAIFFTAALARLAASAGEDDACISDCIMRATTSVSSQPLLLQDCTAPDAQNHRTCEIDLCFSSWIIRNTTEQCIAAECKDALPQLKTCNQTYTPDPSLVENSAPQFARACGFLAASSVAFAVALKYI